MSTTRAIVTGASEGIGRAFALALSDRGYAVTLVARNEAALDALLPQLSGQGHIKVVADLTTADGVDRVVQAMAVSPVNLLVNNAGAGLVGAFAAKQLEQQLSLVRLNIEALTHLTHAFCRQAKSGDALINVSSVLAAAPQPAQPMYAATKAFVSSLTESLWHEMRSRNVLVMALQPGATRTRFNEAAGRPAGWQRPSWLSQSPEAVVACALGALDARRGPTVTSGFGNQVFVWVARVLPRRWLVALMARTT